MIQRGTNSKNREDLGKTIEGMGGIYSSKTDREWSKFQMEVMKDDVNRAIGVLGDMVCNSNFDANDLEALKEEVSIEHEADHQRYRETLLNNVHFNAYRDHMMGQPIKGDRDNVAALTEDHVRSYHNDNYYGDNIVVVATGNVTHDQVVDAVEGAFSSLKKSATSLAKNSDKCVYVPALMHIRDDAMVNSNVGVFYDAPSWKHEDFYAFMLLKNMFGNYRIDKHAEHLNDVKKQYNSMHVLLGELVDVTKSEAIYSPYSDCGLFGNYFYGNEVFTRQMNYCGVCLPTIYSHYLNDVEVIRGRNKLYNKLMNYNDPHHTNSEIGQQILYLNRRVPRSEVAKRVAHIDNYHMKNMCNSWFYDAEPSFTNWGPIEGVSQVGSYKYFKVNTMSTVLNTHHTLFT